jgi:hypothetical protein
VWNAGVSRVCVAVVVAGGQVVAAFTQAVEEAQRAALRGGPSDEEVAK